MKRVLTLLLILFTLTITSSPIIRGQSLEITAFNSNGPMGEVLFPQDSVGNITLTGIVNIPYSADTIKGLVQDYLYMVGKSNGSDVKDMYNGLTIVGCEINLKVGARLFAIPYAGTFIRPASKVSFKVLIEIRNGMLRYTLNNFYTKRWRISGEGKDQGPSNMLHWQRINSINKDAESDKEIRKNKDNMIKAEEYIYKEEYKSVMDVINGFNNLSAFTKPF